MKVLNIALVMLSAAVPAFAQGIGGTEMFTTPNPRTSTGAIRIVIERPDTGASASPNAPDATGTGGTIVGNMGNGTGLSSTFSGTTDINGNGIGAGSATPGVGVGTCTPGTAGCPSQIVR